MILKREASGFKFVAAASHAASEKQHNPLKGPREMTESLIYNFLLSITCWVANSRLAGPHFESQLRAP